MKITFTPKLDAAHPGGVTRNSAARSFLRPVDLLSNHELPAVASRPSRKLLPGRTERLYGLTIKQSDLEDRRAFGLFMYRTSTPDDRM